MNKLILTLAAFSLMAVTACGAGGKSAAEAPADAPAEKAAGKVSAAKPGGLVEGKAPAGFKRYAMDNDYFSCDVPADWFLKRDQENDEEYDIYEIELVAPRSEKTPTAIFVSYHSKNSDDFADYKDFIERNSKNIAGETKNKRESYEPVKKTKLAKREAFELSRERLVFLHPESKSDESVQLKEKHYVLPAKEGFYVLHFTAAKTLFAQYSKVFEKVAGSFTGKY